MLDDTPDMPSTREFMIAESHQLTGAKAGVPPRNMRFTHAADAPRFFFYDNNAAASSLFAVFSAVFPPGERFLVESVRRFRDAIADETLRAQISGFSGQEYVHSREHEKLNQWFAAQGIDLTVPDRAIRVGLWLLSLLPASQQLACTTFMEHVTAAFAEEWLSNMRFRTAADPQMLRLWSWHGLEELEHKAVAFAVHRQVSRHEYAERVLAFGLVLTALLPGLLFSWAWLVVRHGRAATLAEHRRGIAALFGEGGFVRNVAIRAPDYLERGFHPAQHDTTSIECEWRERLFGAQGELVPEFRNHPAVARAIAGE